MWGIILGIVLLYMGVKNGSKLIIYGGLGILILPIIISMFRRIAYYNSMGIIIKFVIVFIIFVFIAVKILLNSPDVDWEKEIEEWKTLKLPNKTPEEFIDDIKILKNKMDVTGCTENIPIGRCIYFSQSSDKFIPADAEADFIVYEGKSSENDKEFSFKEYGYLITSEAIYYRRQWKDKHKKFAEQEAYIPLAGAYDFDGQRIKYADKTTKKIGFSDTDQTRYIIKVINYVINSGYSRNLYFCSFDNERDLENLIFEEDYSDGTLPEKIEREFDKKKEMLDIEDTNSHLGGLVSSVNAPNFIKEAQTNQMLQGKQGHGVAAEWGNTVVDRTLGKRVETQVGGTNLKHGADRSINGINVQTKYCQSAGESINSYINNIDGYFKNNTKQVEVPRDQYAEAIKKMERSIVEGKIPGESNPLNVKKYVRKGFWTYDQANQIAKAGTIPSLTVDLLGGVQCALPGASISAVITYWNARSNGVDVAEAKDLTLKVFSKSMIVGTMTYVGTWQLAKYITTQGGKQSTSSLVAKIAGENAAKTFTRLNYGLAFVTQVGPSFANLVSGKGSGADLGTTSTTFTFGLGGGKVGAAVGTCILPGVGTVVGMAIGTIAGGTLGSSVGKAVFGESSQSKMMKVLKQEFIDIVYTAPLTSEETKNMMSDIFSDKKLKKKLKEMYASSNCRTYCRQEIIFPQMRYELSCRMDIQNDEYEDLIDSIELTA